MAGLVQIQNVPDHVRLALKARAAAQGESFNEYLLKMLIRDASKPTVREVLARASARTETMRGTSSEVIARERGEREREPTAGSTD